MKKVLTMTLNPCVDRTVYMESFRVGGTNIVNKVMEEVAGKGINVAVGLKHLRVPVKTMGFSFKEDSVKLYQKLEAEQIPYAFVEVEGHLRVNQKLFDESKSEMTECNEKGTPVTAENVDSLLALLQEELAETSILVLSGSVPPGVDSDIYAVMIAMAKKAGVKVVLDASGELLRRGVEEKPYLIKPNKEEFVKTFLKDEKAKNHASLDGENLASIAMLQEMVDSKAKELLLEGISYICLSLGADGAMMFRRVENGVVAGPHEVVESKKLVALNGTADTSDAVIEVEYRPAIAVPVRSLQGAGDAMVAGICKAIYDKQEEQMLEYALHMAASTIQLEGTAMGESVI